MVCGRLAGSGWRFLNHWRAETFCFYAVTFRSHEGRESGSLEGSRDQPDHHAHQPPAAIPVPLVAPPHGTRGGPVAGPALTAAAASGLAATPAWAAGGYHIIATIAVGDDPSGVAVSPRGTRAYVTKAGSTACR